MDRIDDWLVFGYYLTVCVVVVVVVVAGGGGGVAVVAVAGCHFVVDESVLGDFVYAVCKVVRS